MLSVIIPVYNVQTTLDRCVASILRQGVDDMQVILVDDGSTDESSTKCESWAKKDNRIEVVHQKNKGLSAARNAGLDKAKGDLVTFVDSDDFVQDGTYAILIEKLDQHPEYDILEFPVFIGFGSKDEHPLKLKDECFNSLPDYWVRGGGFSHAYAWNKIYRKSIFDEVRFPEGRVFEDVQTIPEIFKHCKCLATTKQGLYYYCVNENGITAKAGGEHIRMLLEGYMKVVGQYPEVINDDAFYIDLLNTQLETYRLTGDKPVIPVRKFSNVASLGKKSYQWKAHILNTFGLNTLCQITKVAVKATAKR